MMKIGIYTLVLFLSFSALSFSQEEVDKKSPPAGNANKGDYYGEDVSQASEKNAISVGRLENKLKNNSKVDNVVVKGEVLDVCKKRGCWITIKTENGSSFFVKMKDYAFFVPVALKGKNVILEGSAEKEITSVDELRHYAKDAKKSKTEIEAITFPKEEIHFLASRIKVIN